MPHLIPASDRRNPPSRAPGIATLAAFAFAIGTAASVAGAPADQAIPEIRNAAAALRPLPAAFTVVTGTEAFVVKDLLVWKGTAYIGTQGQGVQTMNLDGSGLKASLAVRGNCFAAQGDRVYAGTSDGVHLSEDKGTTWRRLGNMAKDESILSLAVEGDTLFAGTFLGLYVSRDGGARWARTGEGSIQSWTSGVAASGSLVYAGSGDMFTGYSLSRSEDGGRTWKAAQWNGRRDEIIGIRFVGEHLHVGTNGGLHFSPDRGANWVTRPGQGEVFNAGSFFDARLGYSEEALFFGTDQLDFVSFDNGLTWSYIQSGGNSANIFAKAGANLLMGTSRGVFLGAMGESIPVRRTRAKTDRKAPSARQRGAGGIFVTRPGAEGEGARVDGRALLSQP